MGIRGEEREGEICVRKRKNHNGFEEEEEIKEELQLRTT